jgi:hypothetical protein
LFVAQHAFEPTGVFAQAVEAASVAVVVFSAGKQGEKKADAGNGQHDKNDKKDAFERHGARGYLFGDGLAR